MRSITGVRHTFPGRTSRPAQAGRLTRTTAPSSAEVEPRSPEVEPWSAEVEPWSREVELWLAEVEPWSCPTACGCPGWAGWVVVPRLPSAARSSRLPPGPTTTRHHHPPRPTVSRPGRRSPRLRTVPAVQRAGLPGWCERGGRRAAVGYGRGSTSRGQGSPSARRRPVAKGSDRPAAAPTPRARDPTASEPRRGSTAAVSTGRARGRSRGGRPVRRSGRRGVRRRGRGPRARRRRR